MLEASLKERTPQQDRDVSLCRAVEDDRAQKAERLADYARLEQSLERA